MALLQRINEKQQVINEYESGRAIPNNQVMGKLERALGGYGALSSSFPQGQAPFIILILLIFLFNVYCNTGSFIITDHQEFMAGFLML